MGVSPYIYAGGMVSRSGKIKGGVTYEGDYGVGIKFLERQKLFDLSLFKISRTKNG
jgi:hypothetical protein